MTSRGPPNLGNATQLMVRASATMALLQDHNEDDEEQPAEATASEATVDGCNVGCSKQVMAPGIIGSDVNSC